MKTQQYIVVNYKLCSSNFRKNCGLHFLCSRLSSLFSHLYYFFSPLQSSQEMTKQSLLHYNTHPKMPIIKSSHSTVFSLLLPILTQTIFSFLTFTPPHKTPLPQIVQGQSSQITPLHPQRKEEKIKIKLLHSKLVCSNFGFFFFLFLLLFFFFFNPLSFELKPHSDPEVLSNKCLTKLPISWDYIP